MFFGLFHMYDFGVSYTINFRKKIMESSLIFLWNGVLILNRKEIKEAGSICFELRARTRKYFGKSDQKIMEVVLLWKKTKLFFRLSMFLNIITEKWG